MIFEAARAWAEAVLNRRVMRVEPLVGATSSTLFRLIQEQGPTVVLRLFTNQEWLALEPDLAEHEAAALVAVASSAVPTPLLLAFDSTGEEAGTPALLMSDLPGSVVVRPRDETAWLDGLAQTLTKVHEIELPEFPWSYRLWQDLDSVTAPAWAENPDIWAQAIDRVRARAPGSRATLIHRDFHPTNVLWSAGDVSGVIDWVNACLGPWEVDVAHCRLNLAAMHGTDTADAFGARYETLTGRTFNPVWDLVQVIEWLPDAEVYPPWLELGLSDLDTPTVRARLEQFAAQALSHLSSP